MLRSPTMTLFGLSLLLLGTASSGRALAEPHTKKEVIQRARASTVYIVSGKYTGSGFVVDREQRLVVTCAHVTGTSLAATNSVAQVHFPLLRDGSLVSERDEYKTLPGITARVVELNSLKDLCILQLDRLPPEAIATTLAESSAEGGDDVFTIGNPATSQALWVYTSGTVRSVYHKQIVTSDGQLIDARIVETQAPINHGDSGGPLFDTEGKIVGVNSYSHQMASLVSSCIDVSEVKAVLTSARKWLKATLPSELRERAQHYSSLNLHLPAVMDADRIIERQPGSDAYILRAEVMLKAAPVQEFPNNAYRTAIADCVQALRFDPKNGRAYGLRGTAFLGVNAFDQAVADYSDAIRLQPEVVDHLVQRGLAHSRRKDYDSSLKDFESALVLKPGLPRALVLRAEVLLEAKDFARAVEGFTEAIKVNPKAASLYDFRGDAYVGLSRFEDAVRDYTQAIELQPNTQYLYVDRAHALNELRQYQGAIADTEKALTIQPREWRALHEHARAAAFLGRYAIALEDIGKVIDSPVTSLAARKIWLDMLVLQGRVHLNGTKEYEKSVAALTRAIDADPSNAEAFNLRAIAHSRLENLEQALKDYSVAVTLVPKSVVYLTNRSAIYVKLEKYEDAVKDLTAAIELNTKSPVAYEYRSKAYDKLGEKEKSEADAATARELRKTTKK